MSLNIQPMAWFAGQPQDDAVGQESGGKQGGAMASVAAEPRISQPAMYSGAMPNAWDVQPPQGAAANDGSQAGQNPLMAMFQKVIAVLQNFFSSMFGGGTAKTGGDADPARTDAPSTPSAGNEGAGAPTNGGTSNPQNSALALVMGMGQTGQMGPEPLQKLQQALQSQGGAGSTPQSGPGKPGSWSSQVMFVGFAMSQNGGTGPATPTPRHDAGASGWRAGAVVAGQSEIQLGSKYTMKFNESRSEMVLVNHQTGHQTRIWGDPHLNFSNSKGKADEVMFKGTMSFKLPDNTKITVQTEPAAGHAGETYSNKVTLTNGDEAYVVDGLSQNRRGDLSVQHRTDGQALDAALDDGYVMTERADGQGFISEKLGHKPTQAELDAAHA